MVLNVNSTCVILNHYFGTIFYCRLFSLGIKPYRISSFYKTVLQPGRIFPVPYIWITISQIFYLIHITILEQFLNPKLSNFSIFPFLSGAVIL